MVKPSGEESLLVQAVLNQSRIKIIEAILNNPLNVSQISKKVNLDRSTVVYHLGLLSKVGLVDEETKPVKTAHSTGVMGRYFSVNEDTLKQAVKLVNEQMTELTPEWPQK